LEQTCLAGEPIRLVSTKRVNGEAPAEPAYVDRIIEGLAPEPGADEGADTYNPQGWPRYLRLETRLGTQPYEGSERTAGFTASAVLETPNHGTLSLDANYAGDERRGAFTLRQRELPLDGGWVVNNELGVVIPLAPVLMRLPSRVFIPSDFVRGAGTEWINAGLGVQGLASTGKAGRMEGYPVSVFDALNGDITTVGAQGRVRDWTAAARYARARDISYVPDPRQPADFLDSDSTQVAVRHEGGRSYLQANAMATRSDVTGDTRKGAWIDGEWKEGAALYGYGLYRLDPDLSWNGQLMAGNIQGGYARVSAYTRGWSVDAQVDTFEPVSGAEDTGVLVTGSGRWRYSRSLTLSAGGSLRRYQGNAGTAFGDIRQQNDWGLTGLRADLSKSASLRSRRLTLDQGWILEPGWSLNTSLTAGSESGEGAAGSLWGAAVSFAAPLGNDVTFSGNASTERRGDGSSSAGANLNLAWRLSTNWSVEGNFTYSEGRSRVVLPIDPLAPPPDRLLLPTDARSFFLVLRYEDRAGSSTAPLGGTPKTGGGAIEGVVFLDANRTGAQEAGETGASGVTVYLDGRYAVRTDSQGRFAFPFVAPGKHAIVVLNETLPLPWEAGERGETRLEVAVRETTRLAIPVVRRSD
jgi:hypothetical protein